MFHTSKTETFSRASIPHGRFLLKSIGKTSPVLWGIFDIVIALASLKIAYDIAPMAKNFDILPLQIVFFPVIVLAAGTITGLYDREVFFGRVRMVVSLAGMVIISVILLAMFTNLVIYQQIGRYVLAITGAFIFIGSGVIRIIGYHVAKIFKIRVLMIGNSATNSTISETIRDQSDFFSIVGFCEENHKSSSSCLGAIENLPEICLENKVDLIVIRTDYMRNSTVLDQCFHAARLGCRILDECSFYEHFFEMVLVDKLDPSWFYTGKLVMHKNLQPIIKRLMDILIGVFGLIVTLPLLPFIWAFIRLTSWGPALYVQTRCGQFGKPFKIYKFRTMVADAEKKGAEWASDRDRRITPFGYFLRKTRLDEIPQFYNMIRGDMSVVGPRPERPEMLEKIEEQIPYFRYRNLAKPGLTGLAQIKYRYGASIEDAKKKLQYDLFYIKNWNIFLDIQIILRTFTALVKGSR